MVVMGEGVTTLSFFHVVTPRDDPDGLSVVSAARFSISIYLSIDR